MWVREGTGVECEHNNVIFYVTLGGSSHLFCEEGCGDLVWVE